MQKRDEDGRIFDANGVSGRAENLPTPIQNVAAIAARTSQQERILIGSVAKRARGRITDRSKEGLPGYCRSSQTNGNPRWHFAIRPDVRKKAVASTCNDWHSFRQSEVSRSTRRYLPDDFSAPTDAG